MQVRLSLSIRTEVLQSAPSTSLLEYLPVVALPPLNLEYLRLWYNGCPKYERYHYASQFVYSKAEKGKKIGLLYLIQEDLRLFQRGRWAPRHLTSSPPAVSVYPSIYGSRESVTSAGSESSPFWRRNNRAYRDEPWEFANDTDFRGPVRLHQLPGIQSLPPGLKEIVPKCVFSSG